MAIEANGQETVRRSVQPGQDSRPWERLGFRMEAVPGAPPAGVAQPGQGAPPNGNGQQPSSGDGFRGMFSDINDEQWPTVEPHLRNVQAHVTRLEQVAKPIIDAGLDQQGVTQLLGFAQNYNQDPVGTWLAMASTLTEAGVLSDELDLDELQAIVTGQPNPNAELEDEPGVGEGDPVVSQLRGQVEQLTGMVQSLVDDRQQERTQRETSQQNALLDRTLSTVQQQLKDAGVPAPADELIIASIIANKGNPSAVVEQLTGYKGSVLETVTGQRQQQPTAPRMPRGAPVSQQKPKTSSRDPFAGARAGAEQFLKQANEQQAQEV